MDPPGDPSNPALLVSPLPPDEPPRPVVRIALSPQDEATLGRLRAVLQSGDRGPAARRVAEESIEVNAASYSAWQVLWECLLEMAGGEDRERVLREEMAHITEIGSENPKNYQVWNHRRKVASLLGTPQARAELAFSARVLAGDAKNYHAWAHRQAFVQAHALWEPELDFTAALLRQDVRNNSAWSHRAWVVDRLLAGGARDEALLAEELGFARGQLARAYENESAWNYLRFLLDRQPGSVGAVLGAVEEALGAVPGCPGALGMYLECAERALAFERQDAEVVNSLKERARAVCDALAESDPIRARYWREKKRILAPAVS